MNDKLLNGFQREFNERMIRREAQDKKCDAVKKKNDDLIAYWRSITWYQFWKKPSFEEQRKIIINNWNELRASIKELGENK